MAYQDYGIYGKVVWQFQQSLDFHNTESCISQYGGINLFGRLGMITLSSLMSNSVFNIEGIKLISTTLIFPYIFTLKFLSVYASGSISLKLLTYLSLYHSLPLIHIY